jgi:hypothetical protein
MLANETLGASAHACLNGFQDAVVLILLYDQHSAQLRGVRRQNLAHRRQRQNVRWRVFRVLIQRSTLNRLHHEAMKAGVQSQKLRETFSRKFSGPYQLVN